MALLEELTLKENSKDNMDGGKMALYASGEKKVGTKKVYAMVQWMRDLVRPKMCKECLESIIKEFPKCCDGKQGGRILGTSCDFRYELYPFLKTSDLTTVGWWCKAHSLFPIYLFIYFVSPSISLCVGLDHKCAYE